MFGDRYLSCTSVVQSRVTHISCRGLALFTAYGGCPGMLRPETSGTCVDPAFAAVVKSFRKQI